MIKQIFLGAGVGLLAWVGPTFAAERLFLPLTWSTLVSTSQDWSQAHQGLPEGVPEEYDWAHKPRLGAGNDPGSFTAFTGWGQVFSVKGGKLPLLSVSIRNMQVLVCHSAQREWVLLQQGKVEGAQFRPDYKGNINVPPAFSRHVAGITSVQFEKGTAYHFWPQQGRVELPPKNLCGILVLLQARTTLPAGQALSERDGVLLGLGADYWRNKAAPWDNYQSNRDVAIGRLKWLDATWRWFGMSTASIEDLRNLYMSGYTVTPLQAK